MQHALTNFTWALSTVFQSYDYTLQKVKISTRIPLRDIVAIAKGRPLYSWLYLPLPVIAGAYIVSPLEEASRDPIQNAGFSVEWRNAHQITRVTSYSVRNSVEIPASPTGPYVFPLDTPSTSGSSNTVQTSPLSPSSESPKRTASASAPASASASTPPLSIKPRPPPLLSRAPTRSRLSRLLSSTAPASAPAALTSVAGDTVAAAAAMSFAAFKALPIDPARTRRDGSGGSGSGGTIVEPAAPPDEFAGTCREAVDYMVDCIVRACRDAGDGDCVPVVRQEDIVRSVSAIHSFIHFLC